MDQELHTVNLDDWVIKLRLPKGAGPHPVLLLLHGWTGDENVMWIFASRLPDHYLMLSPRGLFPSSSGGYGWHKHRQGDWPEIEDFRPAVDAIIDLLPASAEETSGGLRLGGDSSEQTQDVLSRADFSTLSLLGFSQGAALAYTIALQHPQRVHLLGGLAGFMPEKAESLVAARPLEGKQVFVSHGVQDELVPIEKARRSVELLEQAGSAVTYCEEDAGHKLSAPCFRALETFFANNSYASGNGSSRE